MRPASVVVPAASTFTCSGLCRIIACPSMTAVAEMVMVASPVGAVPLFNVRVATWPPAICGGVNVPVMPVGRPVAASETKPVTGFGPVFATWICAVIGWP
jgi:hypothetical protein